MNISKLSLSSLKLNSPLSKGLLFLVTIFISNYCYSGVYKWVDEQGNIHYGQQRPSNIQSEQMSVQNYAPDDTSSYKRPGSKENSQDGKEQAADDKNKTNDTKESEKKPESKADKKRRMAACAQARKGLANMRSSGRVRNKEKDGSINYLSEKQKSAKMKQDRKSVV